jgi:TPR repeat protein
MKNSLFKEQKYTEAFNIFRQAAEFGDPRAQCYLGTLYLSKMGIPDQEFVMADVSIW